jgi:hypothetical protein
MDAIKECLPEKFKYKILKSDYSTLKSTSDFSASFYIKNIQSEDDFLKWFEVFKQITLTDWIVGTGNFIHTGKKAKFAYGKNQVLYYIVYNYINFIYF